MDLKTIHKLSIIIPCYNEERTLDLIVKEVLAVDTGKTSKEIIIVDDCSTDTSAKIAKNLQKLHKGVRLIQQPKNRGKGAALQRGFMSSTGDAVIIQDADREYDPRDFNKLLEVFREDRADIVFGSRFSGGAPRRRSAGQTGPVCPGLLASHNQPYTVNAVAFADLGQSSVAGIPLPLVFVVITFVTGWIVLNRSVLGRKLLSVGGNREASRLAGIRTAGVVGGAYVISGTLAAFAGVISASQLGVGQGTAGTTLALQSIAIVVIGGTSLLGGEGSIVRTAVGLLIIASLDNLFFSLALDSNWQSITQGAIVIAAVGLDQLARRSNR